MFDNPLWLFSGVEVTRSFMRNVWLSESVAVCPEEHDVVLRSQLLYIVLSSRTHHRLNGSDKYSAAVRSVRCAHSQRPSGRPKAALAGRSYARFAIFKFAYEYLLVMALRRDKPRCSHPRCWHTFVHHAVSLEHKHQRMKTHEQSVT